MGHVYTSEYSYRSHIIYLKLDLIDDNQFRESYFSRGRQSYDRSTRVGISSMCLLLSTRYDACEFGISIIGSSGGGGVGVWSGLQFHMGLFRHSSSYLSLYGEPFVVS